MDISSTMLVALMFVGLLSISIGNILIGTAIIYDNRSDIKLDWIHIGWTALLLLVCFDLFWQTIDLFTQKEWGFGGFLYVILGPILITFAGQILLPDLTRTEGLDLKHHYSSVNSEFFILFALLEFWQIGVDFFFGDGLTRSSAVSTAAIVLLLALAFTVRPSAHRYGIIAAALLFLLSIGIQISGNPG